MSLLSFFLDGLHRICFLLSSITLGRTIRSRCFNLYLCNKGRENSSAKALKQGAIKTIPFNYIDRSVWLKSSYCIFSDEDVASDIIRIRRYLESSGSLFSAHNLIIIWAVVFHSFEVAPICCLAVACTDGGGALVYANEQYQ